MRNHLNLVLAGPLATLFLLTTVLTASAARYSAGDTSGQLYVQAYTRFTSPYFHMNTNYPWDPNSCGFPYANHINQTMWFTIDASQPVPLNGNRPNTWVEAGYFGGYNIGIPNLAGCDIGYYYYSQDIYGYTYYVPMGIGTATNNYWIRFVTNQIGTSGAYVIINNNVYQTLWNQWCCSSDIEVGLELNSAADYTGWYSSSVDFSPLAWYDLNWNVSYWRGCTTIGFPNNCSRQDTNMGGSWANVWNDYQDWYYKQ